MPYVDKKTRAIYHPDVDVAPNPGVLNYQLTALMRAYILSNPRGYRAINDCLGALEGAKLEMYAMYARVLEDEKIEQNGGIW